jgi:hypothetical protein
LNTFASSSQLSDAVSLVYGPDENLYVTGEGSGNVVRFDGMTGAYLNTFVPNGTGGLASAHGLAFGVDGDLYVSSQAFSNEDVKHFDGNTGAYLGEFVPAGSGDVSPPLGIAFGPDSNLYVASRDTNQVLRYNGLTGAFMGVFASGGGLTQPGAVTWGPDGNLYVCSLQANGQILRYNGQTGSFMDVFAQGGGLSYPNGAAFGPDGDLYVAGQGSGIQRYDGQTGAFLNTFIPLGSSGLTNPADLLFHVLTGSQTGITVTAGPAKVLTVTGFPSSIVAGTTHGFTVMVKDAYGNLASGYLGTVHFTSPDTLASLPADYPFTAGDGGMHVFQATLRTAGAEALIAGDVSNHKLNGKQNVRVTPGAAVLLLVTGYPSTTTVGTANLFYVIARDAFGNTATGYRGTVTFTSTGTAAQLPVKYTFTAGDGGIHLFSATFETVGTWSLTATDSRNNSLTGEEDDIQVLSE